METPFFNFLLSVFHTCRCERRRKVAHVSVVQVKIEQGKFVPPQESHSN